VPIGAADPAASAAPAAVHVCMLGAGYCGLSRSAVAHNAPQRGPVWRGAGSHAIMMVSATLDRAERLCCIRTTVAASGSIRQCFPSRPQRALCRAADAAWSDAAGRGGGCCRDDGRQPSTAVRDADSARRGCICAVTRSRPRRDAGRQRGSRCGGVAADGLRDKPGAWDSTCCFAAVLCWMGTEILWQEFHDPNSTATLVVGVIIWLVGLAPTALLFTMNRTKTNRAMARSSPQQG
jgi:hypothetical protein